MRVLLTGGLIRRPGNFEKRNILIDSESGSIEAVTDAFLASRLTYDISGFAVFPGFADVHVHLREPGFSYKETIASGTLAAARGGYTAVCSMPNLDPAPDCAGALRAQTDIIDRNARVQVYPYGTITLGERGGQLSDFSSMPRAVAFSDDGRGVQNGDIMRRAMTLAADDGRIIAAHCEDESLLEGGYIHLGAYSRAHGHAGISSESEWRQVERDLRLAAETGCRYHVCHVSTAESVELIRRAKAAGVDVTCETAPHYLLLCEDDIREDGRFKMNPPLRSRRDMEALRQGISDGTVDMIATDHAPHSAEEKSGGLRSSKMGVSGLEAAFPALYTGLVLPGLLSLDRLLELMSAAPRRRFGLPEAAVIPGAPASLTVFDLGAKYVITGKDFLSMGKSTPFEGREVYGRCVMTLVCGREAWRAI